MQSSTFINMTLADGENNFDNLYTLEKFVSTNFGWKIVYNVNEKYFIEDIIGYAFIRHGAERALVPITVQELHFIQPLQEYILKDYYVGVITPENDFLPNEYTVEDIKHVNVQAIKEAMKKNRINLD